RSAGYNAAVYESAEAFLYLNGIPQTDCLVLDMRMPGLSGLQLQKKLSEMQCLIPVIFVTAHSGDEVRATALGQGAVAFLSKPFHDEALLDAIELATHPAGTQ
ncbi:MAG: hypothetical protein QOJ42_3282, partial [Acidobacteriaceae bacterium]|nr:hypothetical protein [Acidobacteriaceae bacterium]